MERLSGQAFSPGRETTVHVPAVVAAGERFSQILGHNRGRLVDHSMDGLERDRARPALEPVPRPCLLGGAQVASGDPVSFRLVAPGCGPFGCRADLRAAPVLDLQPVRSGRQQAT